MSRRFTKAQAAWCRQYEGHTTFEPLMDDFLAGNESFVDAAKKSVRWFEDWKDDAYGACSAMPIPGAAHD